MPEILLSITPPRVPEERLSGAAAADAHLQSLLDIWAASEGSGTEVAAANNGAIDAVFAEVGDIGPDETVNANYQRSRIERQLAQVGLLFISGERLFPAMNAHIAQTGSLIPSQEMLSRDPVLSNENEPPEVTQARSVAYWMRHALRETLQEMALGTHPMSRLHHYLSQAITDYSASVISWKAEPRNEHRWPNLDPEQVAKWPDDPEKLAISTADTNVSGTAIDLLATFCAHYLHRASPDTDAEDLYRTNLDVDAADLVAACVEEMPSMAWLASTRREFDQRNFTPEELANLEAVKASGVPVGFSLADAAAALLEPDMQSWYAQYLAMEGRTIGDALSSSPNFCPYPETADGPLPGAGFCTADTWGHAHGPTQDAMREFFATLGIELNEAGDVNFAYVVLTMGVLALRDTVLAGRDRRRTTVTEPSQTD